MLKIERLIYAMATVEGWNAHMQNPAGRGSRAYRNKNPGNLRQSPFQIGHDGGFSIFETDMDGFAAFKWDIMQKAKGNTRTGLNGESTLRDLIYVWAPPSDNNDTEAYIKAVTRMTGFDENMKLNEFLPIEL